MLKLMELWVLSIVHFVLVCVADEFMMIIFFMVNILLTERGMHRQFLMRYRLQMKHLLMQGK